MNLVYGLDTGIPISVREGQKIPAIFEFFVIFKSVLYGNQKRCE